MFTELVIVDQNSILSAMLTRVGSILRDNLTFEQFNQVSISFHFFPDKWDHDLPQRPSNPTLYPDLPRGDKATQLFSVTKRVMDIVGSLLILVICRSCLSDDRVGDQSVVERPGVIQATAGRTIR